MRRRKTRRLIRLFANLDKHTLANGRLLENLILVINSKR